MKLRRTLTAVLVAVLAGALLAPAAGAMLDEGGASQDDARYAPFAGNIDLMFEPKPVRPDDWATPRFVGEPTTVPTVTAQPTGIDWTDVGIGAGIAVGAMLLLLGSAYLMRHPPTRHGPIPSH